MIILFSYTGLDIAIAMLAWTVGMRVFTVHVFVESNMHASYHMGMNACMQRSKCLWDEWVHGNIMPCRSVLRVVIAQLREGWSK